MTLAEKTAIIEAVETALSKLPTHEFRAPRIEHGDFSKTLRVCAKSLSLYLKDCADDEMLFVLATYNKLLLLESDVQMIENRYKEHCNDE